VALVGGTVGGNISFAGARRQLDADIKSNAPMAHVNMTAVIGIIITCIMRCVLFLPALGVVWNCAAISDNNPAAPVFEIAAGNAGYKFFGVVMWAAAITSVIGASFTSVSFWKRFHPALEKNLQRLITAFILISTIVFVALRQPPIDIFMTAGVVNGLILPVALAIMLIAVTTKKLVGFCQHPLCIQVPGWLIVA